MNLIDVGGVRANQTGFGITDINNPFDFNRDSRVNLIDLGIARTNQSGFTPVNLITPTNGAGISARTNSQGGSDTADTPLSNELETDALSKALSKDELAESETLTPSPQEDPLVVDDFFAVYQAQTQVQTKTQTQARVFPVAGLPLVTDHPGLRSLGDDVRIGREANDSIVQPTELSFNEAFDPHEDTQTQLEENIDPQKADRKFESEFLRKPTSLIKGIGEKLDADI